MACGRFSRDAQWKDTQSCHEMVSERKEEKTSTKNHLAENSDDRAGDGSNISEA